MWPEAAVRGDPDPDARWPGLARVLHPEQRYVIDACRALDVDAAARWHGASTSTCAEKAALLGWPLHRVVKALYFSAGNRCVGVVLPELSRRLNVAQLVADALGLSRKQSGAFRMNGCPEGMERGTCTPFPWRRSMGNEGGPIKQLILHRDAGLAGELVDISLGGSGVEAHRVSCQLRYADLVAIVRHAFGTQAVSVDLTPYLDAVSNAPYPADAGEGLQGAVVAT